MYATYVAIPLQHRQEVRHLRADTPGQHTAGCVADGRGQL